MAATSHSKTSNVHNGRTRGVQPSASIASERRAGSVKEYLKWAGNDYCRVRDYGRLLGNTYAERRPDPDLHFAVSPVAAISRTEEIASDLFDAAQKYLRKGREGDGDYDETHFADLFMGYAAERLTSAWMRKEMAVRAGLKGFAP